MSLDGRQVFTRQLTTLSLLASLSAVTPARAQNGGFVYVANQSSNNVSAYTFDAVTGALTPNGTFAAGARPRGMAVDPSGQFVYVVNQGSNTVTAYTIDGVTGALSRVGDTATGSFPQGVTVDPTDRFVYVTNCMTQFCFALVGPGSISAYTINPSTGALTPIGTIACPNTGGPASIVVDPSSRFAYTANRSSNNVTGYTINGTTGALTCSFTNVPAGSNPYGSALDPSGRFLYIANDASNSIPGFLVDETTGALSSIPMSPFPAGNTPVDIVVDPSGQFVYSANCGSFTTCGGGGTVSAYTLDPSSGSLTAVDGSPFTAGSGSFGVITDPTGQFLYVTNSNDTLMGNPGTVSAFTIDASTGALSLIETLATGDTPIAVVATSGPKPPPAAK